MVKKRIWIPLTVAACVIAMSPIVVAPFLLNILKNKFYDSNIHNITDSKTPKELNLHKNAELVNVSNGFLQGPSEINVYKHKESEDYYVNVIEVFKKMDNFFRLHGVNASNINNKFVLSNNGANIYFSEKDSTISFKNFNDFSFIKTTINRDYNKYINEQYTSFKLNKSDFKKINLAEYGFNFYVSGTNLYLPVSVFNLLFCSPNYFNLQFNGEKLMVSNYDATHDINFSNNEYVIDFYKDKSNIQNAKQRNTNLNFLALLFDHFHGLSNQIYKENGVKNFKELLKKYSLNEQILKNQVSEHEKSYYQIWYKYFDDLHSRIISKSYAAKSSGFQISDGIYLSKRRDEFRSVYSKLIKSRREKNKLNKITHFYKDTARIILDSFLVGTHEQINSSDRFKYDSYWLMNDAIREIKRVDKDNKIKNIVLDISLNGGGSSAALQRVLGFITNRTQNLFIQDRMSEIYTNISFTIDTNQDGLYNYKDSYNNYNWYILAGKNTFSAANVLAHSAKTTKYAKLIGQKSGGGMFAVLPTVLPDGTHVDISSQSGWTSGTNNKIRSIDDLPYTEHGVEPDYYIPYEKFYDDNILENLFGN